MAQGADAVIIGAGIMGSATAYHLARRGVSVIIVAADHAGTATDTGAGIICPWADQADDAGSRLAAEGARYYPELLAMLVGDGQADTGYAKVARVLINLSDCYGEDRYRLSTLLHADRIFVFDQGRVAESGTHAELEDRNGIFTELAHC